MEFWVLECEIEMKDGVGVYLSEGIRKCTYEGRRAGIRRKEGEEVGEVQRVERGGD